MQQLLIIGTSFVAWCWWREVAAGMRGYVVVENLSMIPNDSIVTCDLLHRRYRTEHNFSTVGLFGHCTVHVELPCDAQLHFAAYMKVRHSYNHAPSLQGEIPLSDIWLSEKPRENTPPEAVDVFSAALRNCTIPQVTCPIAQGTNVALEKCTFSGLMTLPARQWNVTGTLRMPEYGPEIGRLWIDMSLDDTPLLKLKQPSRDQLNRRSRNRTRTRQG